MINITEQNILSTHHEVLGYMVTGINCKHHDNATITLEVTGKVQVRLQWGSDGDMRRGDGYATKMTFPFTSTLIASYKNPQAMSTSSTAPWQSTTTLSLNNPFWQNYDVYIGATLTAGTNKYKKNR